MTPAEIADFLATIRLFRDLDERELIKLARHFKEKSVTYGGILFREGDPGGDFYIITSGKIHLARGEGEERIEIGDLSSGEFFGGEAHLENRGRFATATANGETSLLVMMSEHFGGILQEHPNIKEELKILTRSYEIWQRKKFEWLEAKEIIHMITRKHPYVLLGSLLSILPLIPIGLYLVWIGFTADDDVTGILIAFLGIMLAVPTTLLALWRWLDWGNDYYILTNKRVVWLEEVFLFHKGRNVVPLDAVLSVDVNTSFWQRLWGAGDVVVNTFTEKMTMKNAAHPKQFADVIEEYWHRAQNRATEMERQTRIRVFRENFGLQEKEETLNTAQETSQMRKPNSLRHIANFLKTRYEENGTVTYRKHWFLFFRDSWKAFLFLIVGIALLLLLVIRPVISFGWLLSWLVIFANFVAVVLVLYYLVDWANDIYQVTDRHIFDIDRKPLGQDTRKSAPLEQILSTKVEQNFWQRLLNYGDVLIRVGEAEFTFDGVVNPSMVQKEIFNRLSVRKQQIEAQEAAQERERMVEWLKIYHEQVGDNHNPDHEPDF